LGLSQPGRKNSKGHFAGSKFSSTTEITVSRKEWLTIAGSAGVGLLVLVLLTLATPGFKHQAKEAPKIWNHEAIQAMYVAAQLRELDKSRSSLILSYDLNNLTDLDYRLSETSGVVVMSRLKSDGSFSQEERIRLSYPVFLPARQHARLAIELSEAFAWPREDSHYEEKLKGFVKRRLAGVKGFVLFDEASHNQIDLPAVWPQLREPDAAGS
jgi:hypothetical protein